jgi:hypothetical protein
MQAMLDELLERSRRALAELDSLFNGAKSCFSESIDGIIREFKLTEEEVNKLNRFRETMLELLDRAREQAKEKLPKLVAALERRLEGDEKAATIERCGKVLRVRPAGERWFVSAHFRGCWLFALRIHNVNAEAVFPDVLKLPPEKLESLQSGWRASDEGYTPRDKRPVMGTTKPWQVLAWSATRYGNIYIAISTLHLNKRGPAIAYYLIAKDWKQQWRGSSGKQRARAIARTSPLGLLTMYLGDGDKSPKSFAIFVGYSCEYYKVATASIVVETAYKETDYGRLLDVIKCDKWLTLKNIKPKEDPVHAHFNGYTFCLSRSFNSNGTPVIRALALTKSEGEAQALARALAALGVQATVRREKKYWIMDVKASDLAKLAELLPEWRNALRELVEKKKFEPRGPVTRKLLELAGSPPLP